MEDVQCDAEVDPSIIARGCPGMSGADLRNLVNEAAVKAARDGADMVKLSVSAGSKFTVHLTLSS